MATGTANRGYDYEDLVPAYLALKLIKNREITSFSIELNCCRHKKFEDLHLSITRHSKEEEFAFQLKHREKNRDVLDAKEEFTKVYHSKEKNFNIDGYRKASVNFKGNCHLILFTNVRFENLENIKPYEKTNCEPFETNIFDGYCFKVKNTQCFSRNDEKFFEKFVIASSQKSATDIEKAIISIFEEDLHSTKEKAICFYNFFHQLRSNDYNDSKICRDGVILKLTELLLFDYKIDPKNQAKNNKHKEILEEISNSFDITVFPKTLIKDVEHFWTRSEVCLTESEKDFALQLKLQKKWEKQNNNNCYFFGKPLLLDISSKSEKIVLALLSLIATLQNIKIKLVLMGKQCDSIIDKIDKSKFKVFKDLKDIKIDTKLHELISLLQINIQGKKATTLKTLKEEFCLDFEEHITTDDMFSIIKGNSNIGNNAVKLPDYYIPRNLIKDNITSTNLEKLCKDNKVIIHCNNSEKAEILKQLLIDIKINVKIVVNLGNKKDKPPERNVVTIDYKSHCDNNQNCSHLKPLSNAIEWISKTVNPTTSTVFEKQINILCGERGTGKTTMLKMLALNCPQNLWAVPVSALLFQEAISIFQKTQNIDKVLEMLVSSTVTKDLDKKISKHLFNNKKVVFFFDGISELSSNIFDVTKTVIREIAIKEFKMWISCDHNLKEILQKELNTAYCYLIEEISIADQKDYIGKRLQNANMQDLSRRILLEENYQELCNMFKDPLLLFIWTEILRNHENDDCITKLTINEMYTKFITESFRHNLRKIGCDKTDKMMSLVKACENYYMQNFQNNALEICLEPDHFDLLKVNIDKEFVEYIKEENDIFGLTIVQPRHNDTNHKISFIHYTFAEYFAARWIFKNFDKIPTDKRNFIMQSKYKEIRRFLNEMLSQDHPLHMAVLNKDLEKVKEHTKTHLNDKDKWGRTALHLASSTGLEHSTNVNIYNSTTNQNNEDKILQYLLDNTKLNPLEKDSFFNWNSFQYADASYCLAAIECLSAKETIEWRYLQNSSKNLLSLIFHCVKNGYLKLLNTIVQHKEIKCLEDQKMSWISLAVQNEQFPTVRFLLDSNCSLEAVDIQDQTALHEAASWGFYGIVEVLLSKGLNIEAKNSSGRTPLQLAATRGHLAIVKLLVSKGAEIESKDVYGRTSLQKAAYRGNLPIVQFLVESGAQINYQNKNLRTALHRACETGYLDTVKYLIENQANPNLCDKAKRTPLFMASQEGRFTVVEFLIKNGADLFQKNEDEKTPKEIATERGYTNITKLLQEAEENCPNLKRSNSFEGDELHKAAHIGDLKTLKKLLEDGKNIEEVNESKETVLHVASSQGHDKIVKHLIEKGANASAKNAAKRIPLHLAGQRGHLSVVKLLLKKSYVSEGDKWGSTPLHRAAYKGHVKVVEALLEAGADIHCRNQMKNTPLHIAALGGHNDVIECLLSKGADIQARNNSNETCLLCAVQNGCTETVSYLLKKNKSIINDEDKEGKTALHWAALKGYEHMVDILVRNGADLNKMDKCKETPLDEAKNANRNHVVAYLESKGANDNK